MISVSTPHLSSIDSGELVIFFVVGVGPQDLLEGVLGVVLGFVAYRDP